MSVATPQAGGSRRKARSKAGNSLADHVHGQLKTEIFDFRLMPGDRLSENEVAARVGAARLIDNVGVAIGTGFAGRDPEQIHH